ncbi:DUF1272 domain-containing protein [Bacillus sp. es.034]|jgi:uncharacterized protein|uniref:DUF1272 domain-containing protein n=1 Tax=Bacillus sp. es.034 TaxID=1761763 RepID=UPI000BF5682F|nr:DUF1272 domain-containing protein [Bacillus sp. es.034]PFG07676.1 hypothetical protein ATG71_4582 [Bacillus sp. es.034]
MGLEMKLICEKCGEVGLEEAYICVHECTFCSSCTDEMANICPNCHGELVRRPKQAASCPVGGQL